MVSWLLKLLFRSLCIYQFAIGAQDYAKLALHGHLSQVARPMLSPSTRLKKKPLTGKNRADLGTFGILEYFQ